MAPHRIIMPRFFRLWIAKGGEEGEEREEESSLQLLTHATAITDINELWVKHVKLSHRSSWSPCVSESVKRKQNLDGGEGKSLLASYRARHEIQVRSRVRAKEASGDSSSRSAMVVSPHDCIIADRCVEVPGIETPRKSFVPRSRSIVIRAVIPRG